MNNDLFLQLLSFIEKTAENRIGFYCWKLFLIDEFQSYQVIFINLDNLVNNLIFLFQWFVIMIGITLKVKELSSK